MLQMIVRLLLLFGVLYHLVRQMMPQSDRRFEER